MLKLALPDSRRALPRSPRLPAITGERKTLRDGTQNMIHSIRISTTKATS